MTIHNIGIIFSRREWMLTVMAVVLVITASADPVPAQSTSRDNPTPLSVGEINGDFNQNDPEYFYSFTAGPGEVTFTLDIKARGYGGALYVTLLDKNGRQLAAFDKLVMKGQSEKLVKKETFAGRQGVIMRLFSGNGEGSYRLRIGGAVDLKQAEPIMAQSPAASGQSTDRDNPTPLTTDGLAGDFHQDDPEYFYSFVAGPGELTFTLDLRARGYGGAIYFTLYDAEGRELAAFDKLVTKGQSEKLVKKETFSKRQNIVMRVFSGNGEGSYSLRIGGPIEVGQARPPATQKAQDVGRAAKGDSRVARPDTQPGGKPTKSTQPDAAVAESADRRVALVIGNGAYKDAPLRNAVNDARDMARTLRGLGFDVTHGENLTKREMEDQIRAFGKKLRAGGVGLFYYSGHGMQVSGHNYLIPIGHNIEKEQDVEYEAVEAGRMLGEIEAAENRLNIVILDACRNNPFARSSRAATRGLALMSAASGTVIAYSTAPGSVASDGEGENGLYTKELIANIQIPGLKIEDVLKRVRVAVKERSNGRQIPWETTALEGDFYFVKK